MYKYTVVEQELYKKALKKLSKTYRNIDLDIKDFLKSINTKEDLGTELKSKMYLKLELLIAIKIKVKVLAID